MSVFEYKDYRAYLKDWVEHAKATRRAFSYRWFAKKAGFHTSNFLMLVIQGKRNLTEESLKKCALGLELNKQEEEFFRNLVFMNQSSAPDDKNTYLQNMLQSKKFRQLRQIEGKQYEYYSTWYHPVVRELVVSQACNGSAEEIAKKLSPTITSAQVAKSIALLESLGMIQKDKSGSWHQTDAIISTGPELASLIVHNYHKHLLDLSKQKMDDVPSARRDVSSLTLGIRRDRLPQIIAKIRQFRSDMLKLVSEDTDPEEVVLLNMQLYPVTHKEGV